MLKIDGGEIPVYCQMTSIGECGGGGWTLAMKMDGNKVKQRCKDESKNRSWLFSFSYYAQLATDIIEGRYLC